MIKNLPTEDETRMKEYFLQTFNKQRQFLNEFDVPPTMVQTSQEWPHLMRNKFLKLHFNKMMEKPEINFDINDFNSKFETDMSNLILISKTSKKFKSDVCCVSLPSYCLQLLASYFKESFDRILQIREVLF